MLGGSVALVLSRIVCSTKKAFIKDALSASSVKTMSSLQSGEIDVVLFGLIKCLSVFHQSRGPVSVFLSFAANYRLFCFTDFSCGNVSSMFIFFKVSGSFCFLVFFV